MLSSTDGRGTTTRLEYDAIGVLTREIQPISASDSIQTTFGYGLAGRPDDRDLPLSITGPVGDSSFTYNADGRMASRQDAAGTTSYTYDGAGRLATLANATAGTQMAYTYNTLSQVEKITYGLNGNTRNFTFDGLHRVTEDELKTSAVKYGPDMNESDWIPVALQCGCYTVRCAYVAPDSDDESYLSLVRLEAVGLPD